MVEQPTPKWHHDSQGALQGKRGSLSEAPSSVAWKKKDLMTAADALRMAGAPSMCMYVPAQLLRDEGVAGH